MHTRGPSSAVIASPAPQVNCSSNHIYYVVECETGGHTQSDATTISTENSQMLNYHTAVTLPKKCERPVIVKDCSK
jgi:hypothetical protein